MVNEPYQFGLQMFNWVIENNTFPLPINQSQAGDIFRVL